MDKLKQLSLALTVLSGISNVKRKEHVFEINREKINAVCKKCGSVVSLENFDLASSDCKG